MAMPNLSWQNVVIGDPKTSITIKKPNSVDEPDWQDKITVYPNPGGGVFKIESEVAMLKSAKVHNAIGQLVYDESTLNRNFYFLDLTHQSNGTYVITLTTDKGTHQQKVVVTK
jgi:hypothetical protein